MDPAPTANEQILSNGPIKFNGVWFSRGNITSFPDISTKLCGATEFADFLVAFRGLDSDWNGPISDDGFRQLLELLFFASQIPDEGRYLKCKFVSQNVEGSIFLLTKIEPLRLASVDDIRRLAPVCRHPECAIVVEEINQSLWCSGIINVGEMGYGVLAGYPGIVGVGRLPTMQFEVFGPGHIRVSETSFGGFEIRAGKIRPLYAYYAPLPIKQLLDNFQGNVCGDLKRLLGDEAEKWNNRIDDWRPIAQLFLKLLSTAHAASHGGAFVFLPSSDKDHPEKYGLRIPYRTIDMDLRALLVEHWFACIEFERHAISQQSRSILLRSEVLRRKLLSSAETVGYFSSVDGCVVLTRDFAVLGFGAKIDAPAEQAASSSRRFKHLKSGEIYEDKAFMAAIGGTRHQSAARFCQIHPGTLIITLSQDGDLTLFTSDQEFAYAYRPLDLPTIENEIWI